MAESIFVYNSSTWFFSDIWFSYNENGNYIASFKTEKKNIDGQILLKTNIADLLQSNFGHAWLNPKNYIVKLRPDECLFTSRKLIQQLNLFHIGNLLFRALWACPGCLKMLILFCKVFWNEFQIFVVWNQSLEEGSKVDLFYPHFAIFCFLFAVSIYCFKPFKDKWHLVLIMLANIICRSLIFYNL